MKNVSIWRNKIHSHYYNKYHVQPTAAPQWILWQISEVLSFLLFLLPLKAHVSCNFHFSKVTEGRVTSVYIYIFLNVVLKPSSVDCLWVQSCFLWNHIISCSRSFTDLFQHIELSYSPAQLVSYHVCICLCGALALCVNASLFILD